MNVRKALIAETDAEPSRLSRGEPLDYRIIRSKRRRQTLAISIERNGAVVVRVPLRATQEAIHCFVKEKEYWIRRKLKQLHRQHEGWKPREFVPGESFLYLGQPYPLQVIQDETESRPLVLAEGLFRLKPGFQDRVQDLFTQWYQVQAETILRQRILHYQDKIQAYPRGERITSARYQWGSCSSKDRLTFSWRLIMAPLRIIDYVVIHELVHLRERNHSSRFWKIVEEHLPDYRERRRWLREHGDTLTF